MPMETAEPVHEPELMPPAPEPGHEPAPEPSRDPVAETATPSSEPARRHGSRRGVVVWATTVVVAVCVGLVCGRWAFGTPKVTATSDGPATVAVAQMTVGRSIPVAVSATWSARPFGVGAASGVLTSVAVKDGATVHVGDVLYTVDLRPVVAGVGAVPAFRDLSAGASGADVTQLQQLLISTGFLHGGASGTFDAGTAAAVRAWQAKLGVPADGTVRAGDVVYAARLPARVQLGQDVTVGQRLLPGDVVLSVLDGTPEFNATIQQGSSVDPSKPIQVTFQDQQVTAVVASTRSDQSGNSILTLTRQDGSPICGGACDQVPLNPNQAVYQASQVVTPPATGPGVPAAAVWFTTSGDPYLVRSDGTRVPVTIRSQGQGGVVVDGVADGTVVVLADQTAPAPPAGQPAEPASTPSAPASPAASSGS